MKRLRLYVAGPMRGIAAYNFPAFDDAAAKLLALGHEVFSPAERDKLTGFDPVARELTGNEDLSAEGFDLRDALKADLVWITKRADAVILLPGWQQSSGAGAELMTARAIGIPAYELAGFLHCARHGHTPYEEDYTCRRDTPDITKTIAGIAFDVPAEVGRIEDGAGLLDEQAETIRETSAEVLRLSSELADARDRATRVERKNDELRQQWSRQADTIRTLQRRLRVPTTVFGYSIPEIAGIIRRAGMPATRQSGLGLPPRRGAVGSVPTFEIFDETADSPIAEAMRRNRRVVAFDPGVIGRVGAFDGIAIFDPSAFISVEPTEPLTVEAVKAIVPDDEIEPACKSVSQTLRDGFASKPGTAGSDGEIRTTAATGGQKGTKIERYDLLPVEPLAAVARHYGLGARKYADRNWERGYEWSKSYAAMQRHLAAFWRGEEMDFDPALIEEGEEPTLHLAAVVFHALALMQFSARRDYRPEPTAEFPKPPSYGELDDRPRS